MSYRITELETKAYNGFAEPTTTELQRVLEDSQAQVEQLRRQVAAQADALAVVTADRDRRLAKLTEQLREEQDARADDRRGAEQWHAAQAAVHAEELKRTREKAAEADHQMRGQLTSMRTARDNAEADMGELLGKLREAATKIKGREARRAARPLLDLIPKPEPGPY